MDFWLVYWPPGQPLKQPSQRTIFNKTISTVLYHPRFLNYCFQAIIYYSSNSVYLFRYIFRPLKNLWCNAVCGPFFWRMPMPSINWNSVKSNIVPSELCGGFSAPLWLYVVASTTETRRYIQQPELRETTSEQSQTLSWFIVAGEISLERQNLAHREDEENVLFSAATLSPLG